MSRQRAVISILMVMMIALSAPVSAEANKDGKPGDEFRKAAVGYDEHAAEAVQQATRTQGKEIGKYLELSAIYREMATIKRNAAGLADQGRWDDINWDRYQQLEAKRDKLARQVSSKKGKYDKNKHSKSKNDQNKHGKKQKTGDHSFLKAADQYEKEASYARDHASRSSGEQKAMYQELAGTFQDMADIKREAAAAAQAGKSYDWSLYKRLSKRRDGLQQSLKQAKK